MQKTRNKVGVGLTAMLAAALTMLAFAGSASAKLTGEYTKFQNCPIENPEVTRCIHSVTEGGEVVLGTKTVPIVNPAVLQGGYKAPVEKISEFVAPTSGPILSKAPQPVPGGLAGLVKCNEIADFILKAACEWTFENGLTGVNSTLELAGTASDIRISETNLSQKVGIALEMPVKFKLDNPFLGNNCYIGSNSNPVIWRLTTGTTKPPEGVEPLTGSSGKVQFLEKGRVLGLNGSILVDNTWSSPGATGCGGLLSAIIDPIVNASSGVPSAAGVNEATLITTSRVTTPAAVKANDAENP